MKNEERRIMQEIQFIVPAALHDEMLRLRNEKQMDFLESLTGMDWGVADEKDAPVWALSTIWNRLLRENG